MARLDGDAAVACGDQWQGWPEQAQCHGSWDLEREEDSLESFLLLVVVAMVVVALVWVAVMVVGAENSRNVTFVQAVASLSLFHPVFPASVSDCGPSATRRVSHRTP